LFWVWLRCSCGFSSRRLALPVFAVIGTRFHGFGVEMKPLDRLKGRRVDADLFHLGNEVENVAAALAFAETVPDIFADAHPKLGGIGSPMNGTRPAQAVSGFLEPVSETVVLQHLLHRDGRFYGLEVNER